ncbi:MAG: hypothetical protein LBP59_13025 [Planctomycetaceae bacterium]|jgi:hypothetical protein|nr:hypothetical protein [Planctomycetaceae bacterium]
MSTNIKSAAVINVIKNNKIKFVIIKAIVFLLVFIVCLSCNRRPALERPKDMPKLLTCYVTVTFGEKPIEGVIVSLVPVESPESKWRPSGITNKKGVATPSSSYGFKGVPEGKYFVSFTKVVDNPDYDEENPASLPNRSLIPLKYGIGKSKEIIEIKAGKKNEFSYTLESGEEYVR